MVAWQWQRGGRGGGGSSMVAVASLAVEAAAWWKRNFSNSNSPFGSAAAAWLQRWQEQGVGGGSVAFADNNFNCHNDDDD